ncbi:hypothetical protein CEXT_726481 [Caerostris extrusa]|uniref:EGF-like domain-containing protein n=1 Tax=Caerostris extrusa TaxID=172846 RepID=A0AAV4RLK9_CAEEX|nr:hypothetical protein CEXT_726481 [Caerostris extrusa]
MQKKGGNSFCECKPEIKGDRCETVYDCTSGKYKNCKGENGTCTYNFDTNAAECSCYGDKMLHDQENICKDYSNTTVITTNSPSLMTTILVNFNKFKEGITRRLRFDTYTTGLQTKAAC